VAKPCESWVQNGRGVALEFITEKKVLVFKADFFSGPRRVKGKIGTRLVQGEKILISSREGEMVPHCQEVLTIARVKEDALRKGGGEN